ncbi:MAG TPA: hypothetical protein DCP07_07255 [Lachnospiraceae bacterium]|nr:hypothetical protein [Lachnospiraceae bacterium]
MILYHISFLYFGTGFIITNKKLQTRVRLDIIYISKGNTRNGRRLALSRGHAPSDYMKEGDAMVTYTDLFQLGLLIVAIINLVYKILRKK